MWRVRSPHDDECVCVRPRRRARRSRRRRQRPAALGGVAAGRREGAARRQPGARCCASTASGSRRCADGHGTTCAVWRGRRTGRWRCSSATAAPCCSYRRRRASTELPPATTENLRRVAWSPDGSCALDRRQRRLRAAVRRRDGALLPRAGRPSAHACGAIAWRPDGAYALIGAYASRFAGYPRPHMLYRCDGRYTQGILATDDEDDALSIDWRPGAALARDGARRVVRRRRGQVSNKVLEYSGWGHAPSRAGRAGDAAGGGVAPGRQRTCCSAARAGRCCARRATRLRRSRRGRGTISSVRSGSRPHRAKNEGAGRADAQRAGREGVHDLGVGRWWLVVGTIPSRWSSICALRDRGRKVLHRRNCCVSWAILVACLLREDRSQTRAG